MTNTLQIVTENSPRDLDPKLVDAVILELFPEKTPKSQTDVYFTPGMEVLPRLYQNDN